MKNLKGAGRGLPLYGVLLILPALFLMVLHGWGLYRVYQNESAAIPLRTNSSQERLADLIDERFSFFLAREETRSYIEYGTDYTPFEVGGDDLVLLPSPLVQEPAPAQLEGWFQVDLAAAPNETNVILVTNGARARHGGNSKEQLRSALDDLIDSQHSKLIRPGAPLPADIDIFEIPLLTAAVHADRASHEQCLRNCVPTMRDRFLEVGMSRFRLLLFRGKTGHLRLAAIRQVLPAQTMADFHADLPKGGRCLDALRGGFGFVQGFFINPTWALGNLPMELAPSILDQDQRLGLGGAARLPAKAHELKTTVDLLQLFRIERDAALVEPRVNMAIFTDTTAPLQRFKTSVLGFGAVAIMLILSLGTGLFLLSANVRQKLEQARRTQNFVAAVTHELRTPLASIRLHGEMLQDGIPATPEARSEYYDRILNETERLGVLVENVLEKSRLDNGTTSAAPGDLSDLVARLEAQLRSHGAHLLDDHSQVPTDLAFELAPDLPRVLVHVDSLNSILRNLIGNARKYAPAGDEPILVRTAMAGKQVVLEVLDRGPGVAAEEAEHIFDAFYRVGDEATRQKPGTGLGLHLVRLHTKALGAKITYSPRPGGGSCFTVSFQSAD